MLRLNRLFLLGLSVAASVLAQTPSAHTSPALENDQVRVLLAHDEPHVKHALHEHKLNRVMIYLNAGEQDIITQDGRKTTLKFQPGDVKWSPATGLHTSEVTSSAAVNIVEIEVKKPGDPTKTAAVALEPLKVSPGVYKLEFENAQVRVMRVKFPAHGAVPEHEHALNRVVVYLTDQDSKLTTPDGKVEESKHKAGQVSWGGPTRHKEENVLDTPVEVIVVEFKS
jgi:quercetin dioxygenase-like cupin family protein